MKKWIGRLLCLMMFLLFGATVFASETEDPQFGRASGYVSEAFYEGEQPSLRASGYTHNSKFNGYTIKEVVDVSRYQYSVNWKKVKESGIDYAIIRAGFRGYGESGSLNVDTYYKENMREALQYGLQVGVYFFSQAITEKEAVEEAKYVLNLVKGYDVTLPIVIDFEYASDANGTTGRLYKANLSKDKATKICKAFCETVLEQGYTPMIYANRQMLENGLNASELAKEYKIWLANYVSSTSYQGSYEFWQYTQDAKVPGINGNVDKSFWYIAPDSNKKIENVTVDIKDTMAQRIYGKNRYETSFKIAEAFKKEIGVEKFSNVIVASGKNFADALAGSYLGYVKNAPILMTNGRNAQDVKDYIRKNLNKGGTVYILGGTAAVPEGVGNGLGEFKVKRLSGSTRYETNLEILKEAGKVKGELLVCTGKDFADCLSGSAAKKPILMVSGSLSDKQKEYLSSLSSTKFYILGGEAAVSKNVENQISKYGAVKRIGGSSRYETSVMIAETFFDRPSHVVLAYGNNFPDGLCGGILSMGKNAPMILTRTGKEAPAKSYAEKNGIHKGTVLGGDSLVSNATVGNILGKLSQLQNQAEASIVELENGEYGIDYEVIMDVKDSADDQYYFMATDGYDGSFI